MARQRQRLSIASEQGVALVTALFVMLMVLMLGVSAARAALDAEKSARSERDRHVAFEAAEAALADAERDIEGGADPASPRAALFEQGSAVGFVPGCGRDDNSPGLGLCLYVPAPGRPAWLEAALLGGQGAVTYGRFTGARMPAGADTLPARLPRYLIELLPFARAGESASVRAGNFYRITAVGFGAREHTRVVLQSYYRKAVEQTA